MRSDQTAVCESVSELVVVSGPSTQDGDSEDEWPALGDDATEETGDEVDVDPEDEKAIEMFMNKNPPLR